MLPAFATGGRVMSTEQPGPFDRILAPETEDEPPPRPPDRAAVYVGGTILGLAILLLVLLLPPVSILSRGDDESPPASSAEPAVAETYQAKPRGGVPRLPAGLVSVSKLYDLSAPEDQRGAAGVTVPLTDQETEARALGMYTYIDNRWQRLSDVTLIADGQAVRGDVGALPGNVAVLKKTQATLQVAGLAGAGTTVSEAAASVLTVLHPIVFIPTVDGALAGTRPGVPPEGYQIVPGVVAPDPAVIDTILRSSELRTEHARQIVTVVQEGNYSGISIDYRNLNPTLKEQYTSFIESVSGALRDDGRTLTVTLPMPAVEGSDIDTGAYDWERLGAASDSVIIAGELDQELYFQRTETALDYAVERIDRGKLLLTISSLSVERGGDGLRAMPLVEALGLASTVGLGTEDAIVAGSPVPLVAQNLSPEDGASGMAWDDVARSVTFSYPGRGGKRTVWVANEFSAAFRLELAHRYGIAGVAVSSVAVEDGGADVWAPIRELSDTGTLELAKPNTDLFTPTWDAPAGNLSATSGGAVTWTAPSDPGTYDVTLIVSDGVVRAGQRVSLEVVEPPPTAASD
jgi:hypothetical protein